MGKAKAGNDEFINKFLAICNPFPPSPRLDEKGNFTDDAIQMVHWLASIVGNENVMALYFKPKSPGIVIAEISYEFIGWPSILGSHLWSEIFNGAIFVKRPHLKDYESRIYYSTFPTEQEVRNNGWLHVKVEDAWFEGWNPENNILVNPKYPPPSWCEVPPEDAVAVQLCRNIPRIYFPKMSEDRAAYRAAKAEAAYPGVPGTQQWAERRANPKPKLAIDSPWANGNKSQYKAEPLAAGTSGAGARKNVPFFNTVTETGIRRVVLPKPGKNGSASSAYSRSASSMSTSSNAISLRSADLFDDSDDSDENYEGWTGGGPSWNIPAANTPVPSSQGSNKKKTKKKGKGKKEKKGPSPAPNWHNEGKIGSPDDIMQPSAFSWADDYDDNCIAPSNILSDSGSDTERGLGGSTSGGDTSTQEDGLSSMGDAKDEGSETGESGWDQPVSKSGPTWTCTIHGFQCSRGICEEAKKYAKQEREKKNAAKNARRDDDGNMSWRPPRGRRQDSQQGGTGRGQGRSGQGKSARGGKW